MEGLIRKGARRNDILPTPLSASVVVIEACENYQKQSYRNRYRFYAADGVQTLSFPILHENGTHKNLISEVKIDYSKPWVMQHKRAITSAYGTSAYFEYYQDELFAVLDSQPEKLIDLNTALLKFFLEKTGLKAEIHMTSEFSTEGLAKIDLEHIDCEDLRETIHPKRPNNILSSLGLEKPYFQVFSQKHGFKSDLSIMDLLFNEGPNSILYLKNL
jgi:hypothetical protein